MSSPTEPTRDLPRPWRLERSERGEHLTVGRVRFDHVENPRTGEVLRRTVLEMRDWVNVVALTPENRLVVVRQFRFGVGRVIVEIPGGVIDVGEAPIDAARRELREECGYTTDDWVSLGAVEPNPAFQDNLCHHFLARGATRTHEQELDEGEDIVVEELEFADVRERIRSGELRHALVLTALQRVLDLRTPEEE